MCNNIQILMRTRANNSKIIHFVEENYDLYFGRYLNIDKSDIYDIPDEVDIDYQMTYL